MEEGGLCALAVGGCLTVGLRGAAAGRGAVARDGHGGGDDGDGDGGGGGRGVAGVREVRVVEVSGGGTWLRHGRTHLGEHVVGQNEGHHGRDHLGRGEARRVWDGEGLRERRVHGVDRKHAGSERGCGDAGLGANRGPGGGGGGRSQRHVEGHVEGHGGGAGSGVSVAPTHAQRAVLLRRLVVLGSLSAAPTSVTRAASCSRVVTGTAHSWETEKSKTQTLNICIVSLWKSLEQGDGHMAESLSSTSVCVCVCAFGRGSVRPPRDRGLAAGV